MLSKALQLTDSHPGDILVKIIVKTDERKQGTHSGVLEVSDAIFESEVLQSKLPVLVDFWAPWCSPCHQISPVVEKLAEKFQVQSIPLLLFFKDGKVIEQSRGVVSESVIRTKLEVLLQ